MLLAALLLATGEKRLLLSHNRRHLHISGLRVGSFEREWRQLLIAVGFGVDVM
jgi:hypothetical protein